MRINIRIPHEPVVLNCLDGSSLTLTAADQSWVDSKVSLREHNEIESTIWLTHKVGDKEFKVVAVAKGPASDAAKTIARYQEANRDSDLHEGLSLSVELSGNLTFGRTFERGGWITFIELRDSENRSVARLTDQNIYAFAQALGKVVAE